MIDKQYSVIVEAYQSEDYSLKKSVHDMEIM